MKRTIRLFFALCLMAVLALPLAAKGQPSGGKHSPPPAPKNNTKNNIYKPQPGDDVLDLSAYKHIGESKAKELSKKLDAMVDMHNKRVRKSSTNRAPEPTRKSKECIDVSSMGVISPKMKKRLQEQLQQLILQHNQKLAAQERQQNTGNGPGQPSQPPARTR